MGKVLAWFGLDRNANNDSPPLWHGVSEKTKWGSFLICLALAFAVFAVTTWLLGDATGFAGYLPGICATGTLLISSLIAERALARGANGSASSPPERSSH
ncbi:MAG TPA: hypothetical protein DCY59_12060 [Micrococcaceae bacterium]|nr:hypothetical protein [Micrococcaceae bacterium]